MKTPSNAGSPALCMRAEFPFSFSPLLLSFSKKARHTTYLSMPFKYFCYFCYVAESKKNVVFHQFWYYGFPPSDTILSEL